LRSNGYCQAGKTLPPYDPEKSKIEYNYDNSQAQKALAFSMRNRVPGMGQAKMVPMIGAILGLDAAKGGSIKRW
jgi:hypothetical protein